MQSLLLSVFLLFLLSCTEMRFSSSGQIPVTFSSYENKGIPFLIQKKEEFLFYGLFPKFAEIKIDQVIADEGYLKAYKVSVKEHETWGDFAMKVLSLGLYVPVHYQIEGYGVEWSD